ncbi:host cell division inhibitor Icd-like protein [Muribacter muris]|nr:host cell division inhibitor Icd-like protein [Muribacter muris]MBF0784471.1 host cell division inhibitor Icd-like protein [Muribacter muris]MBF0826233.1 host cell division inhibitor Icd-like protein [Muribacter muris]
MFTYKFLCLDREAEGYQTQVLKVSAPNEDEARWQLSARWRWLFTVAKNLPNRIVRDQAKGEVYA